ncbi:MAG TPA: ATP-binding cassette domain-containing protein, partial [Microthrixaceae bacterium]|nr:ATP-binding cassette domain-containing protein [Microthrixaceae bacterium]
MSGGSTIDPAGSGAARPTVDIRGLCKSFGSNDVLKGVDFHVDQREVVVVLGPSGSGKSTLLRCVNLLETPDSGQVLIDGIDICDEDTDVNAVRRRIGMVFQQFNLFAHLSAL